MLVLPWSSSDDDADGHRGDDDSDDDGDDSDNDVSEECGVPFERQ